MELQQQAAKGASNGTSRPVARHGSKPVKQPAAAAGQLGQQQQQQDRAAGIAFAVGLLPTQLFFAFLFYTDVPALLFVLLTELLLVRGATYKAAVSGAAAIAMRQTNAVWVTFLTGAAMLQMLLQQQQQQQQQPLTAGNGRAAAADGSRVTPSKKGADASTAQQQQQQQQRQSLVAELASLLHSAWQIRGQLLVQFWPLLLLPVAFCTFVVLNGSITLGDKEAHAPSAHLMQPLYWALFCLVNAAPLLLQPSITGPLVANVKARPVSWVLGTAVAVAGGCLAVAKYSLAHPYLLADNRHYTFYIWRKVRCLIFQACNSHRHSHVIPRHAELVSGHQHMLSAASSGHSWLAQCTVAVMWYVQLWSCAVLCYGAGSFTTPLITVLLL
jgi:alpha-1,2-glucosyltransferase